MDNHYLYLYAFSKIGKNVLFKLFFVIIVAVITTNIAFSYKNDTQNSELLSIQTATQNSEVVDAENPLSTKFDEIFKDTYPANRPGASVLISKGDKIILKKGYGLADVEHNLAIKPHMTFRLGSLTKQFTAVAILMLEQEGLLKVTDDINLHLPDYPTHGKIITIENLLTHTAGIFNMTAIPGFFANTSQTEMNTEELLEIFKDLPLDFEPGTKMSYSNSGYVILGAIIEKISNKSYGTFVKERIFAPLGMNNSHYGSAINIIPHRVKGYDLTEEGFTNSRYLSMSIPFAAGSLVSTTGDMLKWHKGLISGQILSHDVLSKAWTSAKLNNGEKTRYGFGWGVNTSRGFKMIRHSGGINGFNTSGLSIIEDDIYVIILSNLPGAADIDLIAEQIGLELVEDK